MVRSLGLIAAVLLSGDAFAFLGTELAPLLQLVSGQVQEIERLGDTIGIEKDQVALLRDLNRGIDRTVAQIETLEEIITRTQGLDPTAVRSLAELNELLDRARGTQSLIEDFLGIQVTLADQAIERSALQSDTAYRMGQEMVVTGSELASESQTASPGRATQISAAASSAQMLSQGVELQTLAQVTELQALLLQFQKSQVARELQAGKLERAQMEQELLRPKKRRKP